MDYNVDEDLVKLNIKKLKSLCTNLGIKFKTKWRKFEYIAEIKKTVDKRRENDLSVSLGGPEKNAPVVQSVFGNETESILELETDIASDELENTSELFNQCNKCKLVAEECLCKRKASTAIPKTTKKKKPELLLGRGVHKFFHEIIGKDAPQPDLILNWKKQPLPSTFPRITCVEIHDYLVQRKSAIDNNSNKHFKGFAKAVAHHKAKDIIGGLESSLVCDQFLYIRSRCYASMKSESYSVVAVLDSLDRTICGGACECTIGQSGICSHVGALLLYVENYARMENDEFQVACTSKPCAWNAPKNRKVICKPLTEIRFNKPRLYEEKYETPENFETNLYSKFDPRHLDDRATDPQRLKQAILDLKKIYPKTGAAHFWDLDDYEINVQSDDNIEVEYSVQQNGDDKSDSNISLLHQFIYNPAVIYRDIDENVRQQFVDSQVLSQEVVDLIERETKEQSANNLWKQLRRGRITSSLFGRILACREKRFPTSLVDTILNPSKLDNYANLPPAMLRGQKLEPIARDAYEKKFNVSVESSGLSLMPAYGFIGASGDGIINDPGAATKGILEIKCPCSIKGTDIRKMRISSIVDTFPSFFLKKKNEEIMLDRNSSYYAQVQGEMAVKKLEWADFVVFNEALEDGLFKERIFFDKPFWERKLFPKLLQFFTKYISPFLIDELEC